MDPADPRFAVPVVTNVAVRPRLHDRMSAANSAPCTLISAPAGWGKTVLAGSWLVGTTGDRIAWIALDPADDDLRRFWSSVVHALLPHLDAGAAVTLRATGGDDDLERMPGQIARALALHEGTVILVLDNLHEIAEPAVHESLLRLVRRPPAGLRLVVTTRRDPPWPLNQLRLAGLLLELRTSDLAFRRDEAGALLAGLGVHLDPADLERLVTRTDGWAAGLRLAAVELQRSRNPADVVAEFSGNDHSMASYLLEDVLGGLAPELLGFLVRVSILDVVCAELADAITGRRDGAVTLAELAAENLFVQAVGGGRWYRLHRLIADVLRPRLVRPRTVRELHRRAAVWYLQQGMPYEAIRYALRGRLWPFAAEMLGVHVLSLGVRGGFRDIDVLLTSAPRAVLLSHPELAAALATTRILQGSPAELGVLTAATRAGLDSLSAPRARRLRVVLDLMEIGNGRADGDLARVAAACRRVPGDPTTLAGLGLAGWDVIPMLVLGNAGTAEFWTGDLVGAEEHLRAAVDVDRAGGMLRPRLNAAAHLALLHCEHGELDVAATQAQAVVDQAAATGWTVSAQVVAAYLALAQLALDRDDPQGADSWLVRVAEVEALVPEPHVQLAAAVLGALRRADSGDLPGALSGLRLAVASAGVHVPAPLTDRASQVEAALLCRTGHLATARQVLAGLRGGVTACSARAAARVALSAKDHVAAGESLASVPGDGGTVRGQVEGALLRSAVAAPSDGAAALAQLDLALRIAAPLGFRRPFLDLATELRPLLGERIEAGTASAGFAEDLLLRMSDRVLEPRPARGVTLTDREQLVLRYLSGTLSNAEMAAEMYLSVNTIKTHQRMIYRKLGAAGRRDAVRRAKRSGLL
ncbi:regulatory protein, LuxR [Pseudonocardia sp. N23]|nr:regulatory protein, LuxR [Pseudonocardia sp. N23]